MKRLLLVCMSVSLVVGSFAVVAPAEDIVPPPWERFGPRTTYQAWEFSTPDQFPLPDQMDNPYDDPEMVITPIPGGYWLPDYDGRIGVWPLSGTIDVYIPNAPDHPDWTKRLWVQLTWEELEVGSGIEPLVIVDDFFEGQLIETFPIGTGDWFHSTYLIELPYNPPVEWLFIGGDIMVDELVVDTQCIPEPTTLIIWSLLGGLAVTVGWRRRRRS